jgi:hypothetical protein
MIGTLKSPWAGEDALRALARLVALDISREPLVALLDELLRFVEHLTPDMRCSILIVDDQESNVSLLERLPGEAGYICVASTMIHRRSARCIGKTATT